MNYNKQAEEYRTRIEKNNNDLPSYINLYALTIKLINEGHISARKQTFTGVYKNKLYFYKEDKSIDFFIQGVGFPNRELFQFYGLHSLYSNKGDFFILHKPKIKIYMADSYLSLDIVPLHEQTFDANIKVLRRGIGSN